MAILFAASISIAMQTPAYRAPRLKGTMRPDLNGLWQALNEANWDIEPHEAHEAQPGPAQFGALFAVPGGPGIVEGNEIPYQPWALAKKKENFDNRFNRVKVDDVRLEPLDPEGKCYLPGVPRATYMPFSVPDHPGKQSDHHRLRVCERQPHHLPRYEGAGCDG